MPFIGDKLISSHYLNLVPVKYLQEKKSCHAKKCGKLIITKEITPFKRRRQFLLIIEGKKNQQLSVIESQFPQKTEIGELQHSYKALTSHV